MPMAAYPCVWVSYGMAIDTKAVTDRRKLRFDGVAALRADLEQLETAHRAGAVRHTGNWTPGQILAHVAAFANYAHDGYPMRSPPWFIRLIVKARKNTYLREGLPVGVRIPGVPGGTVGADNVPFDEGLARLRAALDRIERTAPTRPNPLFGPLTHEEWILMQVRHAELHLSFLHPR